MKKFEKLRESSFHEESPASYLTVGFILGRTQADNQKERKKTLHVTPLVCLLSFVANFLAERVFNKIYRV